ncbi:MAG: hypothetical protein L6461_16405 [Anaerolineae bacterium]|nr:hypothetical protein [Anaerolineae bacterium]
MKSRLEKKKISRLVRPLVRVMPVAAILIGAVLPIPISARRWLITAALIWLQVYMMSEFFSK